MLSNFAGSFSDSAVLLPLLVLLGQKSGFHFPVLFMTAALSVFASAVYFRVPMSVQPLKSIAIAAVASGASAADVRMSAFLLGFVFIFAMSAGVGRRLESVPPSWIHALQFSLGLALVLQAFDMSRAVAAGPAILLALAALVFVVTSTRSWPALGILAAAGLAVSIGQGIDWSLPQMPSFTLSESMKFSNVDWGAVLSLLAPQLVLTTANSVVATEDVCRRYYGSSARLVTKPRLMKSIAVNNLICGLVGGLPLCHGSGGVTALYKGGARTWTSNFALGMFLLGVAALSLFYDIGHVRFSPLIFGTLLAVVGVYHLNLAAPTWRSLEGKFAIALAAVLVVWTRNLLLVLLGQILLTLVLKVAAAGVQRSQNDRL